VSGGFEILRRELPGVGNEVSEFAFDSFERLSGRNLSQPAIELREEQPQRLSRELSLSQIFLRHDDSELNSIIYSFHG
jgi:hypothetical protein